MFFAEGVPVVVTVGGGSQGGETKVGVNSLVDIGVCDDFVKCLVQQVMFVANDQGEVSVGNPPVCVLRRFRDNFQSC